PRRGDAGLRGRVRRAGRLRTLPSLQSRERARPARGGGAGVELARGAAGRGTDRRAAGPGGRSARGGARDRGLGSRPLSTRPSLLAAFAAPLGPTVDRGDEDAEKEAYLRRPAPELLGGALLGEIAPSRHEPVLAELEAAGFAQQDLDQRT